MSSNIPEITTKVRKVPLSVPNIGGNEWTYVKECLDSGWVSSVGAFVKRFEDAIAAYTGAPHAVAMVNATAGLQIALQAVGVMPGDAVLVSDLTFVSPVNAIRYCGAFPLFMDAASENWQMDVSKLELFLKTECELREGGCIHKSSKRRIRAILPVHILGMACEIDRIEKLARAYNLKIVEDAAEGLGVRYQGKHVGTYGDIGVFSFNGNKIMTTGGGGMLVSNQLAMAEKARYLSTQAKDDETEYIHNEIGYNYRLTNIQAALGIAQLEQMPDFIQRKKEIASSYQSELRNLRGIELMPEPAHVDATYWLYTVLMPPSTTLNERKAMIKRLRDLGIEARPLWHPIHALRPYQECHSYHIEVADNLYARAVSLPSSTALSEDDLSYCINVLKSEWPR